MLSQQRGEVGRKEDNSVRIRRTTIHVEERVNKLKTVRNYRNP